MTRILAIARLELRRLLRSKTSFTLLLLVPALQVVLFGYAIRPQAVHVRVSIAAPTPHSAAPIIARIKLLHGLDLVGPVHVQGGATAAVASGQADIGIEVPEVRSMENMFAPYVPARMVVDASNAALTENTVARMAAIYWQVAAEQAESGAPKLVVERLYNPKARSDWTFLPALIGVTVMISMVMLGCLSVARERETGSWEVLLSLPVKRIELMLGKVLPYATLGMVQGVLVLLCGIVLFDLPTRGSVVGLILLLPLFAAAHFLIGYAVSARARTQIDALQGAVAFYLPAMLLSGFLYPFETLPGWAQRLGALFPLTHFIAASRNVLLRGRGWPSIAPDALSIILFMLGAGALALWLQSRQMD